VFGNLDVIVGLSQMLVKRLDERMVSSDSVENLIVFAKFVETFPVFVKETFSNETTKIGDIFLSVADFLKCYQVLCVCVTDSVCVGVLECVVVGTLCEYVQDYANKFNRALETIEEARKAGVCWCLCCMFVDIMRVCIHVTASAKDDRFKNWLAVTEKINNVVLRDLLIMPVQVCV
jgi:hypothetical protein